MSTAIQKAEKTALAPTALVSNVNEILDAVKENLGGGQISASDLQVIKVPAAGGTSWEVETLDGTINVKMLTGVVVGMRSVRAYWEQAMGEGPTGPPQCASIDGVRGTGTPGGLCATCPLSQFGSGKDNSQACRASQQMFTLMGDELIPSIIRVPAGSLKVVRQYLLKLANTGKKYHSVLLNFELEQDKNAAGIKYSKIKLSLNRELTPEEAQAAADYKANFAPIITTLPVNHEQDDYQQAA